MKLYVGGLLPEVTPDNLTALFAVHGQVQSATVVKDRSSNQSRGFGFVDMPVTNEALAAINAVSGTQLMGRTLEVNEAQPRSGYRR